MKEKKSKSGFRFSPDTILAALLLFVPLAVLFRFLEASPMMVFAASCLGIVPLAGWMGRATEHLADHLGEGTGGLLNATFGNATELIIALMALREGMTDMVKASLTGSILGNSLLVLGAAILAGGWKHSYQTFNRTAASLATTLLALSAVGLVVPAIFHHLVGAGEAARERELSTEIAAVLLLSYLLSLWFSLRTHKHLYIGSGREGGQNHVGKESWSRKKALGVLLGSTLLVIVLSELLVGSIEPSIHALGMTPVFTGVILVAIIGNAAEHSSAILMAIRNRMDLALNIAVGSSLQIALFVAPMLVFTGRIFGWGMDLLFTPMEVLAVAISVGATSLVASDGESNWMEGVQLLAVYVILSIAFYFLPA